MRLVDRSPHLTAADLVARFVPPTRFRDVSFGTYEPDSNFSSQALAVDLCRVFAERVPEAQRKRFWRRTAPAAPSGLYLDGAFGVGKTHLLASIWNAHPSVRKSYVTFTELTAFIGFAGMQSAIDTFCDYELLCIDEFELDDVANTLMVVTFLRGYMQDGRKVAVTSNTVPGKLGEDRFSASEFRREIAAIAAHFDELRIDGPDYRISHSPLPLAEHKLTDTPMTSHDDFGGLVDHLGSVHMAQFAALFDDVDAVMISDMQTIRDQDDALRVVHFVDKLYDARIPFHMDGCAVEELFAASYRNGGYSKKYGRAESRLIAMRKESADLF